MIVHMGWVGSSIPSVALEAINHTKEKTKDYNLEFMFHDTEEIIPSGWRSCMDQKKMIPVMRSDILRHCVLQKYGGLWIDCDVILIKNPYEWTKDWQQYTAIKIRNYFPIINSDIIYVPQNWLGWNLINTYIDNYLYNIKNKAGIMDLAFLLMKSCIDQKPEYFNILEPGKKFPYTKQQFDNNDSVVLRNNGSY